MPASSKAQQTTARVALAMKRGEIPKTPGTPAYDMMRTMTDEELRDLATGPIVKPKK
ncbi:hypothetical protein LCGC14_2169160 [marine sediment metagenome]|uniref:DUF3008 domain-containing protein n=1 Tax=marine sediment metagenome TaxID=412755 RepID=A0A0F9ECR6_9ZZZZ